MCDAFPLEVVKREVLQLGKKRKVRNSWADFRKERFRAYKLSHPSIKAFCGVPVWETKLRGEWKREKGSAYHTRSRIAEAKWMGNSFCTYTSGGAFPNETPTEEGTN